MSDIYSLIAIALFVSLAFIALNPRSKACKFKTKINSKGFDFTFETNEKSTPSSQN